MTFFALRRSRQVLNNVYRFTLWMILPTLSLPVLATEYQVYYLGGQSNMAGYGENSELPESYLSPLSDVRIFQGNPQGDFKAGGGLGTWDSLQPGMGRKFHSDGESNQLSTQFGPELGFGHRLHQIFPDRHIAIIKYSLSGSALGYGVRDNWFPDYRRGNGINQYDNMLSTFSNAFSEVDIDGDGERDTLTPAGIIWMQGESDAYDSQAVAQQYLGNLQRLMGLIRASLRQPDLPIVLGRITDSGMDPDDGRRMDFGEWVQQAQLDFVEQDVCADLVKITETFQHLPDGWHYRSQDYIELGIAFADSIALLQEQCQPSA